MTTVEIIGITGTVVGAITGGISAIYAIRQYNQNKIIKEKNKELESQSKVMEEANKKLENQSKIIEEANKKLENQVKHIASTGVALGYYYNFVLDISYKLKETKLKLEIYQNNTTEIESIREFDTNDIRLQVIMPDSLKIEAMDFALDRIRTHRKGDIISKGTNRNFGVNFRFDGENKIVILDFPKPLNAIRKHLLLDPKFNSSIGKDGKISGIGVQDSIEWKKMEQEELENFKETIREVMQRGDEGQHKIEFVYAKDMPEGNNIK